jgi:hypothetical protein
MSNDHNLGGNGSAPSCPAPRSLALPDRLLLPAATLPLISDPLQQLYQAAEVALEALQATLAQRPLFETAGVPCPPIDDVTVLREKYIAVTEYTQFGERVIRAVQTRAVLAADPNLNLPVNAAIRDVRDAIQQAMNQPPPAWNQIASDLARAKEKLGPAFQNTLRAWAVAYREGWQACDEAIRASDEGQVLPAFLIAILSSTGYFETCLLPACQLQKAWEHQLRPAPVTSSVSASHAASDLPAEMAALLSDLSMSGCHYLFRKIGAVWVVRFQQEFGLFWDDRGMAIIAQLLAAPEKSIPALALMHSVPSDRAAGRNVVTLQMLEGHDDDEFDLPAGRSTQYGLDAEAVKSVKQRLKELPDEIEKARANNQLERAKELEADLSGIKAQLAKDTGIFGKKRRLGSDEATKAFGAVSKALNRTYQKLLEAKSPMAALVRHFKANLCVGTGHFAYRPSPPVSWHL